MDNKMELFTVEELTLEEFSIIELEERLEFFPKCTINVPK
jgi:hypothetical protein